MAGHYLRKALTLTGNNKTRAASLLGLEKPANAEQLDGQIRHRIKLARSRYRTDMDRIAYMKSVNFEFPPPRQRAAGQPRRSCRGCTAHRSGQRAHPSAQLCRRTDQSHLQGRTAAAHAAVELLRPGENPVFVDCVSKPWCTRSTSLRIQGNDTATVPKVICAMPSWL